MTLFSEADRVGLYAEAWLDSLAAAGGGDPRAADPASVVQRALDVAPKRDPVTRAMIADLLTYLPGDLLPKIDMASMAHSLECRGPFLDHRVVELALAMPLKRKLRLRGGRSKVVLKQAFAEYLPPSLATRPKMGFGVPLDRWFRGPLRNALRDVLLDPGTLGRGICRPRVVETLIAEHITEQRDHAYRLWGLLALELWFRRHLDG